MPEILGRVASNPMHPKSGIGVDTVSSKVAQARESLIVHVKKRDASDRRTRANNSQNLPEDSTEPTLSLPPPLPVTRRVIHFPSRFLAQHWFPDVPQEEIDYIAALTGSDLEGAPTKYIRDQLWGKGDGLLMYNYIRNCKILNSEAKISEILGTNKNEYLINIPDIPGQPLHRILLCLSGERSKLFPVHDLVISAHCFKFDRRQLIAEDTQSLITPGTSVDLSVEIMDVYDIPMFKTLLDWFYTRDDLGLLYKLVPELSRISPSPCCFDDLLVHLYAEKVIHDISRIASYSACYLTWYRIFRAHRVARELGIIERRAWVVIDFAFRLCTAIRERKRGIPSYLDLSNLAPLIVFQYDLALTT